MRDWASRETGLHGGRGLFRRVPAANQSEIPLSWIDVFGTQIEHRGQCEIPLRLD